MASRWRYPLTHRRRRREPPWVPVVAAAPQLPPPALAARPRKVLARRSRITTVLRGVSAAPAPGLTSRLRRTVPVRRRRVIEPVWPQQAVQAPGFVGAPLDPPRRPPVPRRRRGAVYGPPWPQQTAASPVFVPRQPRRGPARALLIRRGKFLLVPPASDVPPRNLWRTPRRLVITRRGELWQAPVPTVQPAASPGWVPGSLRPRARTAPATPAGVFRAVPLTGATAPVVWVPAADPRLTIRPNLATLTAAANHATAALAPNRALLTITEEA